jgi:hypothetical protein
LRQWRRADPKCVHLDPVPHAGDQKVDGNDLEEQVQAVVPEFFHQTKGNEKPELDDAQTRQGVKGVVVPFSGHQLGKEEEGDVEDDEQAGEP